MKIIKKVFLKIFSFYLSWYGVFDIGLTLLLASLFNDTTVFIVLALIQVYDTWHWYKHIAKNKGDCTSMYGAISENNLLCILGGIGCGKTTLANYIIDEYVPDDNLKYYNYYKKGFKCFDHDYLFLKKALPKGAGVLIDEAGRTYDSFKGSYDKSKDTERSRILAYNKFFRHFNSNKAICIYVDQCYDNMNTSLRKTIQYFIFCRGISRAGGPVLFSAIYSYLNLLFKFTTYNIFSLVDIEYMDFNKLGEFADHYTMNYDAKDVKHFIKPAVELFKNNDTYVFEKYNPCTYDPEQDYVWGYDEQHDDEMMDKNFDLSSFNDEIKDMNFDFVSFDEETKN